MSTHQRLAGDTIAPPPVVEWPWTVGTGWLNWPRLSRPTTACTAPATTVGSLRRGERWRARSGLMRAGTAETTYAVQRRRARLILRRAGSIRSQCRRSARVRASRDVTFAIVEAVGPKRLAYSPGARKCRYDADPGVDTAVVNASRPAWSRDRSTTSNDTGSVSGAAPSTCAPAGISGAAPTGVVAGPGGAAAGAVAAAFTDATRLRTIPAAATPARCNPG